MKCEKAPDPVRELCEWLFEFIKEAGGKGGHKPAYQEGSGWYRAPPEGQVCLYIYVTGPRGKKHPNSVHLATLWTDEFDTLPWVEKGNNWFGSVSADFFATPDDPSAKERAEYFVRRSFKVVAVDTLVKGGLVDDLPTVNEKVTHIVNNDPDAPAAAAWIKVQLGRVGSATALAVREILINVASDAVTKVLLGR